MDHASHVNYTIINLFIEIPRKIIATMHFIIAINDLSYHIMIYCMVSNILFIIITFIITELRRKISAVITDCNIQSNIINYGLTNNIQSYKIDDRNQEINSNTYDLIKKTYKYNIYDSVFSSTSDIVTNISSQFMIGLITYSCRPMISSHIISIEDLMYGVRASSKFVEKMSGIFEYIGNVIRQYKSFNFFLNIDKIIHQEKTEKTNVRDVSHIEIISTDFYKIYYFNDGGKIIRICGENGTGKTTLLTNLLNISYKNAITCAKINVISDDDKILCSSQFRNYVGYAQQIVPLTRDTIHNYMKAVSKHKFNSIHELIINTDNYFNFDVETYCSINNFFLNIDINNMMRDLSGGQAKFIQIFAAIIKIFIQNSNILILDEPTNNLDINKAKCVKSMIQSCCKKGVIILMITHDEKMLENLDYENILLSNKKRD